MKSDRRPPSGSIARTRHNWLRSRESVFQARCETLAWYSFDVSKSLHRPEVAAVAGLAFHAGTLHRGGAGGGSRRAARP
jgi:hypothetical protein